MFSLNINGGTAQTCGANTFVSALSGAGITTCSSALTGTTGTWVATSGANVTGATNPTTTGTLSAQVIAYGASVTPSNLTSASTTNNWNPTSCTLSGNNCAPLDSYVRAQTSATTVATVSTS